MITIIFAPPRTGKTCLLTHLAREAAFDRRRNKAMQLELARKKQAGFKNILTFPQHCVSANYSMCLKKTGYRPRYNRLINPYRLGYFNSCVEVHFNLPYEFICITEAQKYLNSRMSKNFPDWQSRWYEQHGHNYLDIFLDTQRPMLIDVNIRELSSFIEVVELDVHKGRLGLIDGMQWLIRRIENSSLWEKYMSSGKTDKHCYTEEVITADYNVFDCYDSRSCKPKFYDGHFDEDIDYLPAHSTEESFEGYAEYLRDNDDELPDGFYKSATSKR